jgi:hypothetical protein
LITGTQLHTPVLPHGLPPVSRHDRPVQHAFDAEQLWPTPGQLAIWQVPPLGPCTHINPVQQSGVAVQTLPSALHAPGGRQ